MKKVLKPSDVAHYWANQLQEEGGTSGNNFYFRNETIYSYGSHFPIAKHVTNEAGQKGVLFTTRSYSNTTVKHIRTVQSASSHLNLIYCYNPNFSPTENYEQFLIEAENIATYLNKAKKPEIYLNQLNRLSLKVRYYSQFTGVLIPEILQTVLNIKDKADNLEYMYKKAELIKIEENRKQVERIKNGKIQLKKWRIFESYGLSLKSITGKDYLRYNKVKNRVETSQGIEIPELVAKRFYKWILTAIEKGGCVDGSCKEKILDYEVKEVNSKFIIIGCHNIDIKEIKLIAKKLNW